jgi:hypothetical protein
MVGNDLGGCPEVVKVNNYQKRCNTARSLPAVDGPKMMVLLASVSTENTRRQVKQASTGPRGWGCGRVRPF